jgi:methyl-accepting chemotaxis protein
MKTMHAMRIATRLILLISATVIIVFAASVLVTMSRVNTLSMNNARSIAASAAQYFGVTAQARLGTALDEARALANVFESAANTDSMKLTRRKANMILRYFIEKNPQFTDVWVVFEPDAFDKADVNFKGDDGTDDTGRFISSWSRGADGKGVLQASKDYEVPGAGNYYVVPKTRKRESVTDPITVQRDGASLLITSLGVPMLDAKGELQGVLGVNLNLADLQAMVKAEKVGGYRDAYAYIYSENGTVAASGDQASVGRKIEETTKDARLVDLVRKGEAFAVESQSSMLRGRQVVSVGYPLSIGGTGQHWIANVNIPWDELSAASRQLTIVQVLIAIVATALLVGAILVIGRSIARPIGVGVSFARRIAEGDLTATIDVGKREDEIGELAGALNDMTRNLRDMVRQVQDGSAQLASSTEELSANAQQLAEGAQTQASTLEETSASVEELTSSVEQVSEHAQSQSSTVTKATSSMDDMLEKVSSVSGTLEKVAESAGGSVQRAEQGASSVKQAIQAIKEISDSSERIAGIVTVISEIADQTNLLALNASIEAARAGEHGRGFAVVADEVSKLAERSAHSTKEIEMLIQGTLRQVKQGVDLAEASGRSMEEIISGAMKASEMVTNLQKSIDQQIGAIKEIAGAVKNLHEMSRGISAATEEQSTNSKQVSKAIESVNEITQQAASSAEEMASSVEEMAGMAQQLMGMVARFRLDKAAAAVTSDAPAPLPADSDRSPLALL